MRNQIEYAPKIPPPPQSIISQNAHKKSSFPPTFTNIVILILKRAIILKCGYTIEYAQ